ncbi:MAG: gliding motility-associated C-terminal domain-containing protein, partial [Flavobacteriales bacterium]
TMSPGAYIYTVNGIAPCGNASATVTVNETSTPDAGADGSITLCSAGAAIDLFGQLGGSPNVGGTWSGPSAVIGGSYDPATMIAGVYTYTIVATAPCVGDQSTVTVAENVAANAGNDGALTICDAGAGTSLFAQLGGTPQAGGTWSGPSTGVGGSYDPATMSPGAYIYTVNGIAPCGNASAAVTVNETSTPDAGADGTITLCSSGAAIDLFAQLAGTPDAGGTWSGPSPVVGGSFDPSTMSGGDYVYTIAASAPCSQATATVTVTLEIAPNAGSQGSIDLCAGADAVDLLTVLADAPQVGGTWSGPSGAAFNGTYDPGSDPPGLYTYTINGVVCPDASAIATVNLFVGPDAGGDNSVALCNTSAAIDLFTQLTGTPGLGGVWTDDQGNAVTSTFDPATMGSDALTYTITGSNSCPDDSAVLTIAVSDAPQAGTSGAVVLCTSSDAVSLFDGLSGTLDIGGTWTDPSGDPHATIFDPAVDVPGTYSYTVTGTAPCPSAVATVGVQVNPIAYAGEDGSASYCSTNAPVALLSMLGGLPQPNGSWVGPGGAPFNGIFAPATGAPGNYTYTVLGIAPCGSDHSTVIVSVSAAANAGTGTILSLCAHDPAIDLFASLGGQPDADGTWTGPDGTNTDGLFDPAVDAPGAYVYSVMANPPCAPATATIMVNVVPFPNATIVAESDGSCVPVEVTLSSGYTGPGDCTWLLGNGSEVHDCGPITVTYEVPGTYAIALVIDQGGACGADTLVAADPVIVSERPIAGFDILPEFVSTSDPVVYLNNTSTGALSYVWDIAGLAGSTEEDVQYEFPDELGGEYTVCLLALASPDCADTICKVITIDDGMNVSVPNTFTPDGDGINDVFMPITTGIDPRYYHFEIFDRWGLLIFNSTDPAASWDGRTSDGTEAPTDVYVWKLLLKDAYSGDRSDRIGHVSLLR